jgi:hypothetical protein
MSSTRRALPEISRARCGGNRAEMRCEPYWNQAGVSAPIGSINKVSASMTGERVGPSASETCSGRMPKTISGRPRRGC